MVWENFKRKEPESEIEVTPENFEDLKAIYQLLYHRLVKLSFRKSWRDKFHGFEERAVVLQTLSPREVEIYSPKKVCLQGLNEKGHKRKTSIQLNKKAVLVGEQKYFLDLKDRSVEAFYYLGLDECSLVYGLVVDGCPLDFREENIRLKQNGRNQLEEKIVKLALKNSYPVRISLNPSLKIEPKGYDLYELKGYACEGWRDLSGAYRQKIKEVDHLFFQRYCRRQGSLSQIHDLFYQQNIRTLYVQEDIESEIFKTALRLPLSKIKVNKLIPSTFYEKGLAVFKYYS